METPKLDDALNRIRQSSIYRSLVPMQAGTGWPVPIRRRGKMYLCIPFFGMQHARGGQPVLIYPPFATITVAWPSLNPVEYVDLRWKNVWDEKEYANPAGTFPHPSVSGLKLSEYNNLRQRLMDHYESMLNNTIDESGLTEFSELISKLIEPCLLRYYRNLFPKFYNFFIPKNRSEADPEIRARS